MKNSYKFILSSFILIIAIGSTFLVLKRDKKSTNNNNSNSELVRVFKEDKEIVQTDDGEFKNINIVDGTIKMASALERHDFSDFSGLPKLGMNDTTDTVQSGVLMANDESKAIVTIGVNSILVDDLQKNTEITEYLCDIKEKKCEISNILSQSYDGIDDNVQKENESMQWLKWDSVKNNLYGFRTDNSAGSFSIYVCDIQNKKCNKTDEINSSADGAGQVIVPSGIFSPSLEKIALAHQDKQINSEASKSWELLLFANNNLTTPLKTFDISIVIDQDENAEYNGVRSVAWSGDEKKLAIGTTRRIFILDIESGSISLAYVAPADEEGDFYWDESSLFLSSDAKLITFIDEDNEVSDLDDTAEAIDELDSPSINVLKKIDLENSNEISELFRGPGLSLE